MNTKPIPSRLIGHRAATAADAGRPADADLSHDRALVLGGGGSAGNAWLIGIIAGLADSGVDVIDADLVIGTSAGSTAAAQLAGAAPARLLAEILSAAVPSRTPPARPIGDRSVDPLERTTRIIAASDGPADMRRRLGAAALDLAAADGSDSARWHDIVAARLPEARWPRGSLLITAVDARTGDPVAFDRTSGVDVVDAIAASTSSGAAYRIGDGRYIDGGYRRSSENADLAAGYGRVLVLSPLGGRTRLPLDWGMQLAVQVEELEAGGSRVETVLPDAGSLDAFGDNMMDLSRRAPAARAGYDQGVAVAGRVAELWN